MKVRARASGSIFATLPRCSRPAVRISFACAILVVVSGADRWSSANVSHSPLGAAPGSPLPLAPYTPKFLLRRLEKLVLKVGKPIGSSNSGALPEEVNRPDGTPADMFVAHSPEPGITATDLDRMGGRLLLAAGTVGGAVCISVTSWEPGAPNTKEALMQAVKEAFYDFDLVATME